MPTRFLMYSYCYTLTPLDVWICFLSRHSHGNTYIIQIKQLSDVINIRLNVLISAALLTPAPSLSYIIYFIEKLNKRKVCLGLEVSLIPSDPNANDYG